MGLGTFILMAGCSAQTGVVPTGQNSYLVAKQAATGFPGLGNLKAEALQEANQYCVGRGSDLFVTRSTETQPPYALGNYPRAEIEFRCASPGKTAEAAVAECNAKRLHGELKTYGASVQCSNPKIFAAYREAGDPNLDLLNVYLAARLVGAENIDRKRVTEAEYQLELAELESRLTKERCAAVPIVPGPGVEQRRPVHRLFREIGQFWVDFHPGGLAVRPNVSGRLGPVHVVERARAHHCDTGRRRNVSEPAVAMRAKVRGGDIAALGLAVIAHRLAGRNLEILVAHDHRYGPCRS